MDRSGVGWSTPDAESQTGTETGTERAQQRGRARIFTDAYIRGLRPRQTRYKQSEWAPKGEGRLAVWVSFLFPLGRFLGDHHARVQR